MNKEIKGYGKNPTHKKHDEKLVNPKNKIIPYYMTTGLKITDLTAELG
ncbi:MAG: hypothetical protein GPJ54_07560 [Candidatus Heimdallarchaeota archaeon]|nr:hypothetical protein [Candidatus Heimdallarchaeota archaeon]